MQQNIIQNKSYKFALRIINLYKFLINRNKENALFKQILKSGTSIGANIEEALGAQSRNDFIAKSSIAYKEARETKYWLNLLKDTDYIPVEGANELLEDCEELLRILASIIKTTKTTKKANS